MRKLGLKLLVAVISVFFLTGCATLKGVQTDFDNLADFARRSPK